MDDTFIENLTKRVQAGDEQAFVEIYREYFSPIYRFVYFRAKDKDDTNDIVQDVFLKVWRVVPEIAGDKKGALSYLYKTAHNQLIDTYRKKRVDVLDIEKMTEDLVSSENLEDDFFKKESVRFLKEALKKLSEIEQSVLSMRFSSDLSHGEVAEILGKSEEAVRQIQSRGLKNLRKYLNPNYFL